tara:strand:- start:424 stop:915 length:492 start_codon:yes stop_codon:yes gene_type:complete
MIVDEYKTFPELSDADHVAFYASIATEFYDIRAGWLNYWDYYSKLNDVFGFTLDACATKLNAVCSKFYTIDDDGIAQDWAGDVVFCNPFYDKDFPRWVEKCALEGDRGVRVVLMTAYKPQDSWWSITEKGDLFPFSCRINMPGSEHHHASIPGAFIVFGGVNE